MAAAAAAISSGEREVGGGAGSRGSLPALPVRSVGGRRSGGEGGREGDVPMPRRASAEEFANLVVLAPNTGRSRPTALGLWRYGLCVHGGRTLGLAPSFLSGVHWVLGLRWELGQYEPFCM
jgi:hypothetical protein